MGRIITALLLCILISSTHGAVTWLSPIDGHNETVKEDTSTGTTVITLNATSNNTGASLAYIIIEQDPPEKFGIQSGNQLYVKAGLDYEVKKSHRLRLRAQDSVGDDADVIIYIAVEDVNDVEPEFTSATSVTLPTDTEIGSILYVAQAVDEDTVGSLVYSITNGNENEDFVINATTGEISLNKLLNITNQEEYDIDLEVTDGVFTAQKAVTFYLTDVIWRDPQDNQNISLPENTTTDTDIVTLNADNAVVYTMSQDPGGNVFRIRNNKVLYLAEPIDYEQNRHYVLTLIAVASTGRSSEILYTVEVTDVNDEPLEFSQDTETVDISQDTDNGTAVYTAETQDPDSVGSPSFSITGGNIDNAFSINSATGELIVENTLNSSKTSLYTITIEATDGVFTDTLTLTVTINAIVWVEPVKDTTDEIPENLGTFVKNLTAETATVYVIQSVTPETDKFDIDGNQLVLTSALDYEDTKSYTLVLKAIDAGGKSAAVTYMINVTDENDVAPEFQSDESLIIPENTEVGNSIYLAEATDQDTNSTIVYSITGGNREETFSINSSTGILSVNKELSPSSEADLSFSLSIQADDSVHQVLLSLSVIIKSAPELVLPHGGVNVTEDDMRVGALEILNLTSTDLDGDPNPDYTIVDQSHPGTFEINDNKLVASGPFDFENIKEYNVTLQVTDTSKFSLSTQATLNVHILNVNDEKPIFTSNTTLDIADDTYTGKIIYYTKADDPDDLGPLTFEIIDGDANNDFMMLGNWSIKVDKSLNASAQLTYNLTIQANDSLNVETFFLIVNLITEPQIDFPYPNITLDEGGYSSHPVWNLSSTDIDNDPNPTYEIVSQSVDGMFGLSDNNQLVTSATFDYENETLYTVTLSVTDSSSLQRSSTANVTVYINDINDEPPVFFSSPELDIREDTAVGINIYNASTTDPDSTAEVATYSITDGNTNDVFEIDSASGNLTLKAQLNDNSTLQYDLTILANDTVNHATLTLHVNVVTAPVFAFPDYNITIPENKNTTEDPAVWAFSSTDRDGDLNPTYSIVSQSDPGTFNVSEDGMQLITMASFDYEDKRSFNVTLRVTDNSTFTMSTEATLVIYITDVNDNPPVFQSNSSFEISEFTAEGTLVYTAITDDVDTQSTVSYDIIGGNDDGIFSINDTSGEITLAMSLLPDGVLRYDLILQANDSVQTSDLNVTVTVKTAPIINITANATVEEGTSDFQLPLESYDRDGDTGVTYEIVSQSVNDTFYVSTDNLKSNFTFDYENTNEYIVSIRATDDSRFSLSSIFNLTIYVTDVNDLQPVFTSDNEVDIPDTQDNGTVFYTAVAADNDTVGTITYYITDGDQGDLFSIDADSGNLTLTRLLDSDALNYNLTITANDTLNTAMLNLSVSVKTAPKINGLQINVSETDNVYVIWNLTSSDDDGDVDPEYTIINQSEPAIFYINETEHAVVTNGTFDYESLIEYTFVVQVTDSSSLKMSSSATFTVSVINENDEMPEFNSSTQVSLREDTAIGSVVYFAVATDVDGIGDLTYSIIGGNDDSFFAIDDVSGNITLKKSLNASEALSHVLHLQANDSVNVNTINVTFTLSTAPQMIIPDTITVEENVAVGTEVLALNATDLDGNTDFTYEIISQSVNDTFRINEDNTKLVTNVEIDYDNSEIYFTVIVMVSDKSEFNMSSTAEIPVNITDLNDEKPNFTSPTSKDIAETTPNGTVVYNAESIDVDTIGYTTYEVIGCTAECDFSIDAESGNVTLLYPLEPKTVDDLTMTLIIQANDSVNVENLTLTFNIKTVPILHVADVFLPEDTNTAGGYSVLQINSTDLDGDNITFTLTSQSEPDAFTIEGNEVVTNITIDFEMKKNYSIEIRATDSSSLALFSSETLNIFIGDVNDNAPMFTSNTSVVVLQTIEPGSAIYTATTDDVDTVGNVTYYITDGNRNSDFSIEMYSGEVTLENKLDPQNYSDIQYNLTIEANDTVNIAILNLTVDIKTIPYLNITNQSITENTNTSGGYQVWAIDWTDLDNCLNPTFDLLSQSVDGTFQIVNSALVTYASFDYENITEYTATIRITDEYGLSSNETITIFIVDENDVAPEFQGNATVNVWEGTNLGEIIYTVTTFDPDTEGTSVYSIKDGNDGDSFELDATSGNLTIKTSLDFNAAAVYMLQISANDSLNTADFNLTINVKTAPVLNFTGVSVDVSENEPGLFLVKVLNATDLDDDPDPLYAITNQSLDGAFVIDGDKLLTNDTFDYESIKNINVTIRVTDSVLHLTSEDTLRVFVTDVNDNSPRFTSNTEIEIPEDEPVGSLVYTAEADDVDTVGNLSFSIIGGDMNGDFTIDPISGNLTLNKTLTPTDKLTYVLVLEVDDTLLSTILNLSVIVKTAPSLVFPDDNVTISEDIDTSNNYTVLELNSTDIDGDENPRYELVNQSDTAVFFISEDNSKLLTQTQFNYSAQTKYTVTLRVIDSSNFSMSSEDTVSIYILDANNIAPVFVSPDALELPETQGNGSVVYTASVIDPDTIGETTYLIIDGNANGDFEIDADSGNLTLQNQLRPSEQADLEYQLVIQANDSVNTAVLNVSISIKTIPEIVLPQENLTIEENSNTTDAITILNSTDLDGDLDPVYSIISQTRDGGFGIDNGASLKTNLTFDYENLTSYEITLEVMDTSRFSLSSTVTLTIYILDTNDVTPEFVSGSEIYVAENEEIGNVLYTASVDDPDTVGNITFSIADGNVDGYFAIGSYSGELSLLMELNPQSVSDLQFPLLIEANDTVNTASLNLTVGIRTVPYLNITNQTIEENTDTSGGLQVWAIDWNDLDNDQNPTFDLLSQSVDGTFQIVNSTLVTNVSFDYENITEYTATISVTDIYNLTSNGTITVYVDDQNDVAPTFKSNATLDLWEGISTGEVVYTVVTEDPDTVGTTEVTLKDPEGKFNLTDSISGNLTLKDELDFDTQRTYILEFTANDSVNVATFNLTVNVKTAPVLNFTGIMLEVPEDTQVGTDLLTLDATDPDDDPDPQFTIIGQSVDGTFYIDGDKLILNATLDYEDVKNYTVSVRVTDSSLGLTSNDTLTVYVKDSNDNPPRFTSKSQLDLREDTQVGSDIYTATAEDDDVVGELSFYLTGGDLDDFSIDSSSGNVTLDRAIDVTVRLGYSLELMVNDSKNTKNLTLTIDVKTAPTLLLPDNITIVENTNTSMDYSVLTLNFTDLDGDVLPTYELVNQSIADTFRISDDNSFLVTNGQFDFESENVYDVTIRVTDSSSFNMSSEAMFYVYVIDANDVTPVFTSPNAIEIPETQEKDSVIYTAYVNDSDTVGKHSYEIIGGNDDENFRIDSDSGNLSLAKTLQPVSTLNYVLTIQVNDSVNTATLDLNVTVVTIPQIVLPDAGVVYIVEDDYTTEPWTFELNSTDLDGDLDPMFSIQFQTLNDTFEIVNKSILVTNKILDFEGVQVNEIVIQVTDTSTFSLSSSATLTVSILDANDLPPVFTSKTEIYLPEDTNTDSVVYTAVTYDNDTLGTISYSIKAGNVDDDFSIDGISGEMTLDNSFHPGTVTVYNLQIQANDSVNQAVLNLTVYVVTTPIILFPAEQITIVENEDKSTDSLVWICNSQDVDGDKDPEYAIVSQSVNGTFVLNDANTRLITTATFDYENRTSYEIVISVTDSSPLKLSSTATLTVYIVNLNDEPPVFTSPKIQKILDTTVAGAVVYTAVTEDADPEGTVTYAIVDGNSEGDFIIDPASGNITLVNGLNLTATPDYTLIIQANDTVNVVNFTLVIEVKEDVDECASNPCENNATCTDGIGEYICDCIPGFNGTNCTEDINECASDPCQNGANCTQGINVYNCSCVDGYRGVNCEEDIDECASSPCENGATCNDLVNEYNCTCVPGYEGFNCENETYECASNPCQNNATCKDLVNEYQCMCVDGYEGVNCENETNECAAVECQNGAVCNDLVNGFACVCNRGYIGRFCENECPEGTYGPNCLQPCPCVPQGTVSCDHVNGTCTCNEFYKGDRCNQDIDECERNDTCTNLNEGCDNSIGNFTCDCLNGYERNESGVCIPVTSVTTTPAVPAGQTSIFLQVTLQYSFPASVNLAVTATYKKYELEIILQLRNVYGFESLSIVIVNISPGSLVVEAYIRSDSETVIQDISRTNANLASGDVILDIFGQSSPVESMAANNISFEVGEPYSDALACQIYEASSSKCTGDAVCSVKDGRPGCVLKDTEDNLPLILGLGIGIPAFFVGIAIVVLCIAYYNNKTKLLKKQYRRDDDELSEFHKMPIRANTGPPTWPFVGSPEHAEYMHYGDYSSRDDSQQHAYPEDVNGYYDNRVDRDSNSTWEYLFTHLRPGEPYHIKRPKIDH